MQLSDNEISIMLLCSDVGLSKDKEGPAPLTQAEWTSLYNAMVEAEVEPQELLHDESGKLFGDMGYDDNFISRGF